MENENLHVHRFKETIIPPTCKESGYSLYTCECGYEHRANFKPAIAHSFQITNTTPATCENPGSITSTCTACGQTNIQSVPALGHDFGDWVVQEYPSCELQGRQLRKCRLCGTTEESSIAPTGHKHDPETAHYNNGELAEFFCVNCGQTISNRPKQKTQRYWLTKIVMVVTAFAALMSLVFDILLLMSPHHSVTFYAPWVTFGFPSIWIIANVFFLMKTNRIKQSLNYTRWMGIATLLYAVCNISLLLAQGNFDFIWLAILKIIPALLMTVFFFSGAKKKYWLFFAAVVFAIVALAIAVAITIDYVDHFQRYFSRGFLWEGSNITRNIFEAFIWVELAMLIKPTKLPK